MQLTAVANPDNGFVNWTGDATGSANPASVTMTAPRSVTANFSNVCFTLTKAIGAGGSGVVNANPVPNCNGGTQYTWGTVVQLTAVADLDNSLVTWTGDVTGSANPASVTMTAPRSVTANFSNVCFTLTKAVGPGGSGSANASPAPNCNGGTQYTWGTVVQLTAVADLDNGFVNWTGDVTGSANPASVTMTANRSVTANFSNVCFTLTKNATPGGSANASPAPNCHNGAQYTWGTVVQLTAVPNTNNGFVNWTGDATGSANPTSVTMTANRSVTANFSNVCFALTKNATPGGSANASPAPNCNGGTQYTWGTVVQLTAVANPDNGFVNWTGDATGSANPTSVTMTANRSVTANFSNVCFALTKNATPGGSANASPAPNCHNGTQYTWGTVVQLTAVADPDNGFVNWTGDATGSANPASVTMTANRSVTANFSNVCFALTKSIGPGGSGAVNANPAPNCNGFTQYTWGTVVQLTAVPNPNNGFVNWTGMRRAPPTRAA